MRTIRIMGHENAFDILQLLHPFCKDRIMCHENGSDKTLSSWIQRKCDASVMNEGPEWQITILRHADSVCVQNVNRLIQAQLSPGKRPKWQ